MAFLEIQDLHVEVEGKPVLKGIDLTVERGEIHALMGPNGSGKTSLSLAIMGHPKYKVTKGKILLEGEDITNIDTDEKVRRGLFLAFQNPIEIGNIKLSTLLVAEYNRVFGTSQSVVNLLDSIRKTVREVGLPDSMLNRAVFEGFSGGEKKRMEMAQMLILKPRLAILDEPDSGVDVDGLKVISDVIRKLQTENNTGYLIITHYRRILDYVNVGKVHVLGRGKIVASGGSELAKLIDERGYEAVLKR